MKTSDTYRQSAASSSGFHFFQLYQCCPRKFYLKYMAGLGLKYVPSALTFGAAFHEGKATFYRTEEITEAIEVGKAQIEGAKELYESNEQYEKDLYRLPILLRAWIVAFGLNDLVNYEVVAVEQEMEVELANGFRYTGRPDTILKNKRTQLLYIMETKTSGFSKDLTLDGVFYGDQATSYLALAKAGLKADAAGVIADVAYWNKNAKYEDNISCVRSEPIVRTQEDIDVLLASIGQTFSEISQKVNAVEQGMDERPLFARNTYYCQSYGKVCEFADICRLRIRPGDSAPIGFVKDVSKKTLNNTVIDSIAIS